MSPKNPLFVVSGNGDVEQASNLFDAFIKKYGFKPVLDFLEHVISSILDHVKGISAVILLKEFLDEVITGLENILKLVDPVLAFQFFKN